MTNVGNLGEPCHASNFGEERRHIVLSHLLEPKVPEFSTVNTIESVFKGILAASVVTKPDIIAVVGEEEGDTVLVSVDNEVVSRADETMLDEDGLESLLDGSALGLNSEHLEGVAVLGGHMMDLYRVSHSPGKSKESTVVALLYREGRTR